jgi:exosortase/archaeosortase family protein
MKIAWFPIAFLICAIPWPGLFYSEIAWPLQQLAAKVAVKVMSFGGVDAARSGTRIFFLAKDGELRPLNVAEACAGLRSLMTFISLAGAIAFLSNRPMWQRLIIVLSAIPIAIFCNVMRVSGQGLTDYYISEQFGRGFAHTFYGLVMYVPAFFMVLMVVWMLDHLFIDEADEQEKAKLAGAAKAKMIMNKSAAGAASAGKTGLATAGAPAGSATAASTAPSTKPKAPAVLTAVPAATPPVRRTAPPQPVPAASKPAASTVAAPAARPAAPASPAAAKAAPAPAKQVPAAVKPPPPAGKPALAKPQAQPKPAAQQSPQPPKPAARPDNHKPEGNR